MKPFFKELLEYSNHYNRAIINVLADHPGKATEKCIQLLSHIVNVHQIWNLKIQPDYAAFEPWQVHELKDVQTINSKNFELSGYILETRELNAMIEWTTKSGQVFSNSIQDILFQIINHSTYHRAQIASEFRQAGLEPLLTDYIYFKMTQNKNH